MSNEVKEESWCAREKEEEEEEEEREREGGYACDTQARAARLIGR